ncbi:MotA/TolQ/ExbB proton channel family protein [Candidatus Auribacterota bacterium]
MKAGFIGMLIVLFLIMGAILLGGGNFFNIPSLVICIGLPIGLSIASAGLADLGPALLSLRSLFITPRDSDLKARNAQVLRDMISYAYAAGVIGTMIGWIQMLSGFNDFSLIGIGFALSVLTIFYSIIISECFLRPAARRIEGELKKKKNFFASMLESSLSLKTVSCKSFFIYYFFFLG